MMVKIIVIAKNLGKKDDLPKKIVKCVKYQLFFKILKKF